MFYAAKRILECPLSEKPEDYEAALESIGTEESFQRCCEECHEQENLYYAMYEIVDAKMNNRPFEGIFPYYQSLGKKVDRIVYFADKLDFKETPRGTEFNSDFGFICGDAVIVITSNINILLMNNRAFEEPKTDISESVGEDIIGSTIVDISFEHQNITKDKTRYGQPTIILKFDNGKELRFTHNFGELTNKETQARFLTSEAFDMLIEHRDCLFDMCANVSIDLDKIEAFIVGAKMSLDDITKTAIKLVEKFSDEVSVFRSENEREPKTNELISSNWMDLFRLFLTYGLDSNSVYREDEGNYKNLLHCLTWLDNTDIVYKLFRLLLKNGANPNVCLDDESLFEHIDEHVVLDATLMEIEGEDRQTYEKDFRLWLLLMSYGGHLSNWGKIVQIKDNYDIDMFENCEAFSYKKEVASDDWYLHIYITKTGEEVAVL